MCCHVCYDTFETQETADIHILKCVKEQMEATHFVCMILGGKYAGTGRYDLERHGKRVHKKVMAESDQDLEDPGNLSDMGMMWNPVVHQLLRLLPVVTNIKQCDGCSAGTKKRLLVTLEDTFKTRLPYIVVPDGLPTTSEPCKALCKMFNVFYLISAANSSKRYKLYEANEDIPLPKTTCYRRYVFIVYLPITAQYLLHCFTLKCIVYLMVWQIMGLSSSEVKTKTIKLVLALC